jgi:hypothetical protein
MITVNGQYYGQKRQNYPLTYDENSIFAMKFEPNLK